ncbi:MAG: CDP-diacylglycerol--serine O-phosphatidyltransferase [Aeromonas sp.]|nr:CDP-diacylglycerol--serine O-phosphatidyltransferase [Aeromonas sp.]
MFTSAHYRQQLEKLPQLALQADSLRILNSASEFKQRILQLIAGAQRRIYLVALYLQDDEAGREILAALYAAKAARPELDIKVFVDYHRAQRGLIGKGKQSGNHLLYQEWATERPGALEIYGVPVKRREWLGVLHLKGFLFDDTLLYSGASLNNIYLHQQERYRYDRYHELQDVALANSWAQFIIQVFGRDAAVQRLDRAPVPGIKAIRGELRRFRLKLQQAKYEFPPARVGEGQVGVTPLVGLGKRNNRLNKVIHTLLRSAEHEVFICTPYFNPPKAIAKDLALLLRRGVRLTLVIGDKTANDFYIPPSEPFSTIGGLPYLYEVNLRRFAERFQRYLDNGQLNLMLWRHEQNSFHLKGISVDGQRTLITGSNLNPRAWALDLENGLLLQDPTGLLVGPFAEERQQILEHTRRLNHFTELERLVDYPEAVRRLLVRLQRFKAHLLLKQLL